MTTVFSLLSAPSLIRSPPYFGTKKLFVGSVRHTNFGSTVSFHLPFFSKSTTFVYVNDVLPCINRSPNIQQYQIPPVNRKYIHFYEEISKTPIPEVIHHYRSRPRVCVYFRKGHTLLQI